MLATTTRAPRLRLHRETIRSLTLRPHPAPRALSELCIPESQQCDDTRGCTMGCGPTYELWCLPL
jgi:hypothetical protein